MGPYASYVRWVRESLGSIWNGNFKQRGMEMGNDGVDTEWEREWERESLVSIWNGNEDGNRRDKRGMGASWRFSFDGALDSYCLPAARTR